MLIVLRRMATLSFFFVAAMTILGAACWTNGVSAAPKLPARRALQGTIATGCSFGSSDAATLSTAWVPTLGFSLVSVPHARWCRTSQSENAGSSTQIKVPLSTLSHQLSDGGGWAALAPAPSSC